MDSSDNEDLQFFRKSKKFNKKGENIPLQELGFKPKLCPGLLDHRNLKRNKRGRKKKKYVQKSSRQIFLSRLRMIIDVNDLPEEIQSYDFQVNKLVHWKYVKKAIYRAREKIFCYICLQENIVAPQITFCGHIFCFHCILMHFNISQNRAVCPVCKQYTQQSELKTCEPICDKQLKANDEIELCLKYRIGPIIYNSQTLSEDPNFNQIIRKRNSAIIQIFEQQENQIISELSRTPQTDRNNLYLTRALGITRQKLEYAKSLAQKSGKLKLRQNQKIIGNTVISFCDPEFLKDNQKFYQQKSGRGAYLHTICLKYIKEMQILPKVISSFVLEQVEEQFDPDIAIQYQQLSHLLLGQDFELIFVSMSKILSSSENSKYQSQFKKFLKEKQFLVEKQDAQALIRNQIFLEEQRERQRLQKMAYSEFHDINAPTMMDPSEMKQESSFPSLIGSKSEDNTGATDKYFKNSQKTALKKMAFQNRIDDFPDLTDQLKTSKSQAPQKLNGKSRKRKKQKRIDITAELFANRQQQYDQQY